jgi:hypothetical protein
MARTPCCRSHCRACGICFAGDDAFDAHRAGDHRTGARSCANPLDDPRFAYVNGECRISTPEKVRQVEIFGLARHRERGRGLASDETGSCVTCVESLASDENGVRSRQALAGGVHSGALA